MNRPTFPHNLSPTQICKINGFVNSCSIHQEKIAFRIAIKEVLDMYYYSLIAAHSQCHKGVKGYAATFYRQVCCDVKCVEA